MDLAGFITWETFCERIYNRDYIYYVFRIDTDGFWRSAKGERTVRIDIFRFYSVAYEQKFRNADPSVSRRVTNAPQGKERNSPCELSVGLTRQRPAYL